MLVRIVRMDFQPDKVEDFLALFQEVQPVIRSFEGCHHLELCQDADHETVYYTLSKWTGQEALDNYRQSEFFKKTWAKTKLLFHDKPKAYSLLSGLV